MSTIREEFEKREKGFLSPFGCLSSSSKGRLKEEEQCKVRTVFQVDRDRIVFSNAFRRLKHKTQVFLSPLGDAYRTRLTHTLEVAQIARTISRALFLNEDLTEAIALGHDLGHTPFGHGGETALQEIYSKDFTHHKQSLRIVDQLEDSGRGLNLTSEVRDGILKHSKGYGKIIPDDPEEIPETAEGKIVRIADIMAYLNHDLDDAIRSKVISSDKIPKECTAIIGLTHSERAIRMIMDLIKNSTIRDGALVLDMSTKMSGAMTMLRQFLYDNVYRSHRVHKEFIKAKRILSELYKHLLNDDEDLSMELKYMELAPYDFKGSSRERIVCDVIAGMTDRYAMHLYSRIFLPAPLV